MRRPVLRLIAAAATAVAAVVLTSAPAFAHGDLGEAAPGPGTSVAAGAQSIRLELETLDPQRPAEVILVDQAGERPVVGEPTLLPGVICARSEALEPGVYLLGYRAGSIDGDAIQGQFYFEVRPAADPADPGVCAEASVDDPAAVEAGSAAGEESGGGSGGVVLMAGAIAATLSAVVAVALLRRRQTDE